MYRYMYTSTRTCTQYMYIEKNGMIAKIRIYGTSNEMNGTVSYCTCTCTFGCTHVHLSIIMYMHTCTRTLRQRNKNSEVHIQKCTCAHGQIYRQYE